MYSLVCGLYVEGGGGGGGGGGGLFFQAEDGIRDLVRSRGLGDVYKRQGSPCKEPLRPAGEFLFRRRRSRLDNQRLSAFLSDDA